MRPAFRGPVWSVPGVIAHVRAQTCCGASCCSNPQRTSRCPQSSRTPGKRTGSLTARGRPCRGLRSRWKRPWMIHTEPWGLRTAVCPRQIRLLTAEESLPAAAALHTQPGSLRGGHGALQAGDEGGAGVQVPTDPVLGVNDARLGWSAAHSLPERMSGRKRTRCWSWWRGCDSLLPWDQDHNIWAPSNPSLTDSCPSN